MKDKISASLMCADLLNLKKDIDELTAARIDYLHWDIMDGMFVPNFSLSLDLMKEVREITSLKFDTHLMINKPGRYIKRFVEAGSDLLVVHSETTLHLHRVIQQIKDYGVKAGVALNPATPPVVLEHLLSELDLILIMTVNPGYAGQTLIPATLNKIEKVSKLVKDSGYEIEIEVDGNVSFENAVEMKKRGANVFVAGSSSIFNPQFSRLEGINRLRKQLSFV